MKKIFNIRFIPIVITIFIILLSVGYSSFEKSMNISGTVLDVRINADIRITGVSVDSSTANAISSYDEYNVKNISVGMILPNNDSTVTYKISVTNFGNIPMAINSISGLPSNLDYELIDYNLKDKICDNNNNCTLGIIKEFYLVIKYKNNQFDPLNTNYLLNLTFDFKPFYSVTYKNIDNVGLPNGVLEGSDLEVNFPSDVIIKEIKVGNRILNENEYTLDGICLKIFNVNGDVVVTVAPTLITLLLEQYTEGNTTGLIKDSANPNLYYYKGTNEEVSNNFLWYGGHQWRVIEFDTEEKTLTLISQQPLTAIQPASMVWNNEEEYETSYINNWLNDYFWNSLDTSIQSNILNNTFNIGIYNDVIESTIVEKVGLLDKEQYIRAGDFDSFLDIKNYWWLGNYDVDGVANVIDDGSIQYGSPIISYGVRPVIKISDISITEGNDGTLTSSYSTLDKATNTNNVQVGEYINVPYSGDDNVCGSDNMCTFRVVSKDNDSIKVVLNGLLMEKSEYGSPSTISTSHTIYTQLNVFTNNISSVYRYGGNKDFYIGEYSTRANYTNIQNEILSANVGLPTIGEMFSGNDINMMYFNDDEKIFVDNNTIENSRTANSYWTMNRGFKSVNTINYDGRIIGSVASNESGVRPIIFLKNNLNFSSGDGTAQSPYILE